MSEYILQMKNIEKSFPGVKALKNANFNLKSGEVHALVGENGAGKSTLMKILCGIHRRDEGEILLFDEPVDFHNISQSQKMGISIIHQELNMIGDLTVAQNIFIGREPMIKGICINDRKMEKDSLELLQNLGINIDPSTKLKDLTVGHQQMVEIVKAVSHNIKILILDEPTAALTQPETEELFRIMNDLRKKGIGMIYISHRMDEITRISDRVTIMRDGEYILTKETKDLTENEIVKSMVGRIVYGNKKEKSNIKEDAKVVLEVKGLTNYPFVKDVSFKLRKGEILGFAGLMGAGRTEVARAIYGADPKDAGEIFINGEKININSPKKAVKNGICYLSEDRKRYGLLLIKSVAENSVLAYLDNYTTAGFIDDVKIKEDTKVANEKLKIKTPSIDQAVKNLSGGNQQKVIVARWLLKNSDIFIFDEPTKGIDVGAKSEIYEIIEELAKQGKSVIMISSELSEIQRLSDRVLVMCEGRITANLDISDATQETIMKYATMR